MTIMKNKSATVRRNHGFSTIDVLVAIVVLATGLLAVPALAATVGVGHGGLLYTGSPYQLGIQALGLVAVGGFTFSASFGSLWALNRLWGLDWPRERLIALGVTLGADVPFFLGGRNAFVEGIGERLTPIELPPQWLAVVKPPEAIETRVIFASPLLVRDTDAVILAGSLEGSARATEVTVSDITDGYGRNDLQPPAIEACSAVAEVVRWLEQRFGNSRMTGSGSAVFARAGAGELPTATLPAVLPSGWEGRMCRSLRVHPLREWARG